MFSALLLSFVLLGADDGSGKQKPPTQDELARYDAAQEKAAGNAAAQVKLALWCEAHGLAAERAEHLRKAIANDPSNVLAHALLGQLAYHKEWDSSDAIAKKIQTDPAQRAARSPNTSIAALARSTPPMPSSRSPSGVIRTASKIKRSPTITRYFDSIPHATRSGAGWATKSRASNGSSPRRSPPTSKTPTVSGGPTNNGNRASSEFETDSIARIERGEPRPRKASPT